MNLLTLSFLSAFIGAAVIVMLPGKLAACAKWLALLSALAGFGCVATAFVKFDRSASGAWFQYVTDRPWIPSLGIRFSTQADGISLALLLLTGIIAITGVLFSWNVERGARGFFSLFLLIIGGVYGVFQSFDLFLLFVFYEIVIIPKYFLIANWGSTNREYGAMKLTIYSVTGSALILLALMAAYAVSGANSFSLNTLAGLDPAHPVHFSPTFQAWAFPVMFLGFAILAGMWPFHTWAPTGHVAAPTAVSMLLAGVVMKLGSYGALRVAMILFPQGLDQWRMVIAVLASIGILYGALAALAQRDLKFVVGYSSISHMGFVLLGLATLSSIGLSGAVMQMFSHGIIGSLLFAVVGRMLYDRTHTREIAVLGGMPLTRALPFAAVVFVIASVASMGLPGFSGFVGEFTIFAGAWKAFPTVLIPASLGAVVTVGFTLRALQRTFFAATDSELLRTDAAPGAPVSREALLPISFPERVGAVLLIVATLGVGLYPRLLLDPIMRSFESPLMLHLIREVAK